MTLDFDLNNAVPGQQQCSSGAAIATLSRAKRPARKNAHVKNGPAMQLNAPAGDQFQRRLHLRITPRCNQRYNSGHPRQHPGKYRLDAMAKRRS
jgi:hypothetical protein